MYLGRQRAQNVTVSFALLLSLSLWSAQSFSSPMSALRVTHCTHAVASSSWEEKLVASHRKSITKNRISLVQPLRTPIFMLRLDVDEDRLGDTCSDTSDENYQRSDRERHKIQKLPISQLLFILQDCDITIPPSANREDLVELIMEYRNEEEVASRRLTRREANKQHEKYSNSATRKDGSLQSRKIKRKRKRSSMNSARNRRNLRQRRNNNNSPNPWDNVMVDEILTPTTTIAKKLGSKIGSQAITGVANVAKSIRQDLERRTDNGNVDGGGGGNDSGGEKVQAIQEVDWYYVERDSSFNVDGVGADVIETATPERTSKRRRKRNLAEDMSKDDYPHKKRRTRHNVRTKRKSEYMKHELEFEECREKGNKAGRRKYQDEVSPVSNEVTFISDADKKKVNATVASGSTPTTKARQRRQSRRSSRADHNPADSPRKLYNVYPSESNERTGDLEKLYIKSKAEAIDTVGEFVADIVEGKYWNGTHTIVGKKSAPRKRVKKQPHRSRRYWKDRMNEKLDYALGLHEDSKYYKRWEEKLKNDAAVEKGNDPISIFDGRQKKPQRPNNDIPFWEKDGSLKSLLFGRITDTEGIVSNVFDREEMHLNTCTMMFKSMFMSSVAILSYICRWASCRGALPQPIIVFLLVASALSAPRRKKLLTVGITLIAARTLAEALHGYIYGNNEWGDDGLYKDRSASRVSKNTKPQNDEEDS